MVLPAKQIQERSQKKSFQLTKSPHYQKGYNWGGKAGKGNHFFFIQFQLILFRHLFFSSFDFLPKYDPTAPLANIITSKFNKVVSD